MLSTLLALAMIGQGQGQTPAKAPDQAEPPKVEMIPDPGWKPKPGDKAHLHYPKSGKVFAAINLFAYNDMLKFMAAKDNDGLVDMAKKREIALIPNGIEVLVIERHDNQFIGGGEPALEVRILDGDYKGTKVWVCEFQVARLIPKPPVEEVVKKAPVTEKTKPKAKVVGEARAARALAIAENLEKSGQGDKALKAYQALVKDDPDTPSAKKAKVHINALTGRP